MSARGRDAPLGNFDSCNLSFVRIHFEGITFVEIIPEGEKQQGQDYSLAGIAGFGTIDVFTLI